MEPLLQIVEHDIDCTLERDNNQVEQEIENEILNTNTIQTRHDCLIIVNPNQTRKERLIDQ